MGRTAVTSVSADWRAVVYTTRLYDRSHQQVESGAGKQVSEVIIGRRRELVQIPGVDRPTYVLPDLPEALLAATPMPFVLLVSAYVCRGTGPGRQPQRGLTSRGVVTPNDKRSITNNDDPFFSNESLSLRLMTPSRSIPVALFIGPGVFTDGWAHRQGGRQWEWRRRAGALAGQYIGGRAGSFP